MYNGSWVKYMKIIISILTIIMCYLYGSIPFALVIGQLFYHKDVREEGSHNLGGTNAGRVLGKKAGISVIILDGTKCIVSILLTRLICQAAGISTELIYPSALACIVGHCYPIFAGFKGGKGVSSAIAYALMTNIYGFIIGVITFLTTLKLTKYVSLSSILGALSILIATPFLKYTNIGGYSILGMITNALIVALIIYRHKENIIRLKNGTENKVTWL